MTQTPNDLDQPVPTNDDDENPLTAAEIEHFRREETFVTGDHSTPDQYPRLTNLSVGFIKRAIVRPVEPARPEYLTIPPLIRGSAFRRGGHPEAPRGR